MSAPEQPRRRLWPTSVRLRSILVLAVVAAVLGAGFVYSNRPQPQPRPAPRVMIWQADMTELVRIEITLPRVGLEGAWQRHEDRQWYFAADGSPVDRQRWGGGIALLLSGPGANRLITEDASAEQLARFALTEPNMEIRVTMEDGETVDVLIGDATPDGRSYYIRRIGYDGVYTVDYTWYEVLERLVTEPPYPPAE